MAGRYKGSFVFAYKTSFNHPPCFGNFRSNSDIYVSLSREKGQHGLFVSGYCTRVQFQIVNCRTGTLCNARKRSGLAQPVISFGYVDDPIGKHTTAFTPKRCSYHFYGFYSIAHREFAANWSSCIQEITRRRTLAIKRSQALGLYIRSTREKDGQSTAEWTFSPHTPHPTQLLST